LFGQQPVKKLSTTVTVSRERIKVNFTLKRVCSVINRKISLSFLLLLGLIEAFCSPLYSQEIKNIRTIEVVGSAFIYGEDVSQARNDAISNALASAVKQAVGLVITPETVTKNFQLICNHLYERGQRFMQDYKILAESKSENHYWVMVRATLSLDLIREQLKYLGIIREKMPKIIFFISEQGIDQPLPSSWWIEEPFSTDLSVTERTLSDRMSNRGFVVVNRANYIEKVQIAPALRKADLDDESAIILGELFGAELVLVGEALISYASNSSNLRAFQAELSARVIRVDSKTVIASTHQNTLFTFEENMTGDKEALQEVAILAADDLTAQISTKWQEEVEESNIVQIMVKGIKKYAEFVRLRKALKDNLKGVKYIYPTMIKAGEAILKVDIRGGIQSLANELMLKSSDKFVIKTYDASHNMLELELISK